MKQKLWEEIRENLNIIINSAAQVNLQGRIDQAVRVNVSGPLQLMELAQQSQFFETFVQLSTVYVNADKQGYIEESIYQSKTIDWNKDYAAITRMNEF